MLGGHSSLLVLGRAGGVGCVVLEVAGVEDGSSHGTSTMCLHTAFSWATSVCKAAVSQSVAHGLAPSAKRNGVYNAAVQLSLYTLLLQCVYIPVLWRNYACFTWLGGT